MSILYPSMAVSTEYGQLARLQSKSRDKVPVQWKQMSRLPDSPGCLQYLGSVYAHKSETLAGEQKNYLCTYGCLQSSIRTNKAEPTPLPYLRRPKDGVIPCHGVLADTADCAAEIHHMDSVNS
jgi:hypothetical protein